MAYEKNTWASGDVVTSAKLNHMENGIEAASSPYDAEISIDLAQLGDDPEYTIISGNFASLLALFNDGKAPNILVRYTIGNDPISASNMTTLLYNGQNYTIPFFCFHTGWLSTEDTLDWHSYRWTAEDVIEVW